MKPLTLLAVLAGTLLLCSCSSDARKTWVREGATRQDRITAQSECEYQIRLNKTAASEQPELLKLCMQGKGYRLERDD